MMRPRPIAIALAATNVGSGMKAARLPGHHELNGWVIHEAYLSFRKMSQYVPRLSTARRTMAGGLAIAATRGVGVVLSGTCLNTIMPALLGAGSV